MTQHAMLSASSAHRWLACPASAMLEQQLPDEQSEYAAEGTFAHKLAEIELRRALGERVHRPADYKNSPYYSEAMEEHIAEYVSQVMERYSFHQAKTPDPIIMFEQRLDFGRWVPGGFGTGDVVIVSDLGVEVIDLKYGKGVPVSAEGNPQTRLYGLGALNSFGMLYDPQHVIMTIVQPRLDSVSTEIMTVNELLDWAETTVKPIAEQAAKGEGGFKAGEHCRFCKARHTCRTRAEANLALAKYDFAPPETLTNDEIGEILRQAEDLQAWVSDLREYALDQAVNHGARFKGWKLVEGRSNRRYTDETAVLQTLLAEGYESDEIAPRKLIGISTMERLLGKKRFAELLDDYIEKPAGKPTLVPEDDKRPEINSITSAQADFGGGADV